jgi:hypothetical protein
MRFSGKIGSIVDGLARFFVQRPQLSEFLGVWPPLKSWISNRSSLAGRRQGQGENWPFVFGYAEYNMAKRQTIGESRISREIARMELRRNFGFFVSDADIDAILSKVPDPAPLEEYMRAARLFMQQGMRKAG